MTDKPAWTPGPWQRGHWPPEPSVLIYAAGRGDSIAVARSGPALNSDWPVIEEAFANAALIAAAPDLYEALDEVINYLTVYAVAVGNKKARELLDKCTATLARARGEKA